jgi:AcrR family transcriptional regulator
MATRAQASAQRRRSILDAALAAFRERGYDATTIEDIRERSGASVGSLYHHFGGKEGITGAIYLEALAQYQEGVMRALESTGSASTGITAMARFHIRWITEHPDWARFLFRMRGAEGVRAVEAEIAQMNRRVFARVATWAEPHVRAGRLARLPRDLFLLLCLGPAQEYGRLWLAGRTETPPHRAAPALADAAWRAVRGAKH